MKSHLKEINETYLEHMHFAQKCGWRMVLAGLACVIHSIIPGVFVSTASGTMKLLEAEITERKRKAQIQIK